MPRKVLPHIAILLSNMYIVFFLIDRVNTAMQFINNSITKALLLVLCLISTVNASFLIRDNRREQAARERRRADAQRRAAPGQRYGARPRANAPRTDRRSFDAPRRSRYD